MDIRKKISIYTFNIVTIITIVAIAIIVIVLMQNDKLFPNNFNELIKPYEFKGDIDIKFADGKILHKKAPYIFTTDKPFDMVLHLEDIGMIDGKSLSFITKDILVRCELDSTVIFRNFKPQSKSLYNDTNKLFLLELPKKVKSNVITLHYENQNDYKTTFEIKEIKIAKRINLITNYFINKDLYNLVLIICMFTLFISVMLTGNFIKSNNKTESYFHYIGIVCLLIGVFIFATRPLSYYILHKYKVLLNFASYTSLMILPMFIAKATSLITTEKAHPLLNGIVLLSSINIITQNILVIMHKVSFTMMINITHIIILLTIPIIAVSYILTIKEQKNDKNKKIKLSTTALIPLILGLGAQTIINLLTQRILVNHILQIAVLIFFILQSHEFFSWYITERDEKTKSQVYKKLALIDKLTDTGNRFALSEKKKEYLAKKSSFYIILLDIDNLKFINDNYGHKYGDAIIKMLAYNLRASFNQDVDKDIFRIGGDEFVLIYHSEKNDRLEKQLEIFARIYEKASIGSEESKKVSDFGVSYGFSYFNGGSEAEFEKALHIADQNMYEKKSNKKNRHRRRAGDRHVF